MALPDLVNILPPEMAKDALVTLGQIGLWLKAIGIAVIVWLIFHIVNAIFNTKRIREIKTIKEDMKRIEDKIDKILSNQIESALLKTTSYIL